MKVTSSAMARSDSEDVYEDLVTEGGLAKLQNLDVDDTVLDKPNDTTIHSGHFMVSHVHDEPLTLKEESDRAAEERAGCDLQGGPGPPVGQSGLQSTINGGVDNVAGGGLVSTSRTGSGVALAIDGSLTKLFECMTLAHCNKLTSPKWRNFKGINVRLKDKIRLNNIIWREWHMQYIHGASPIVCHFETPVSTKNAGTLEYWKLRLDTLTKDCKHLSRFFTDRFSRQPDDHELLTRLPSSYYELLQRVSPSNSSAKTGNHSVITVPTFSATNDMTTLDESVLADILNSYDTLFTSYNANAYSSSSTTQTPSSAVEEFMDTSEPLPPSLAVDFRGFGRLSGNVSVCSSANPARLLNNPITTNSVLDQSTRQSLPEAGSEPLSFEAGSEPLSFGSEEEVLALLRNEMMSETPYDYLMTDDVPSAVETSGYSSSGAAAAVVSGYAVSVPDGNLVSMDGNLEVRFSNESDIRDYVVAAGNDDEPNRLCNMFFLPDSMSMPSQTTMPIFATVEEEEGGGGRGGRGEGNLALDVDSGSLVITNQQLQDFILRGLAVVNETRLVSGLEPGLDSRFVSGLVSGLESGLVSGPVSGLGSGFVSNTADWHPSSVCLPRVKTKQTLSEAGSRASRSLGSIQMERNKTDFNTRSSAGALLSPSSTGTLRIPSSTGFRIPQNAGSRPKHSTVTLPTLQPRLHRPDVALVKQGTSMLLPKPAPQPQFTTHDWSLQTTNKATELLGMPFLHQFLRKPGTNSNETAVAERNEPLLKQRRTRHKSDQSYAAARQGTTMRPIAVFQPINPLLTSVKRTSAKENSSSVSISLENNVRISPAPPPIPAVDSFANQNLIVSASGQTFVMTTSEPLTTVSTESLNESIRSNSFGENMNSSLASSHSCDYSDLPMFNSSSNRSRHTSNESTGSHFDDFDGRTSKSRLDGTKKASREHRRVSHITAEQKRRGSIKSGFDTLIQLIPDLKETSSARVSKATALHKAAGLCKKLRQERMQMQDEAELLRNEIKSLDAEISSCQLQLPANGAPPMKLPAETLDDKFDEYVCRRTSENWKFFIFSLITRPLLKSFDESVTGRTCNELYHSVLSWLQSHCSLASLRPVVTNSMLRLSRTTSILSDPTQLPDEAENIVLHRNNLLG